MNGVAQWLCVIVSVTGSVYCLALLRDCTKRIRSLKAPTDSSPGRARFKSVGARLDCLCQLLLAATFLGVALLLLAEFSFQLASSLMIDSAVDRQRREPFETISVSGCPPVLVHYDSIQPHQPIHGIDCARKPISDAHLRSLLGETPDLKWLILTETDITDDGLRALSRVPELWALTLADTRVGDPGLQHLVGLRNLQYLSLEGTKITDDGLRHLADLRNVRDLSLKYTEVTDAGLQWLGRLDKLENLELCHTRVTREGVDRLKTEIPDVTIIIWP